MRYSHAGTCNFGCIHNLGLKLNVHVVHIKLNQIMDGKTKFSYFGENIFLCYRYMYASSYKKRRNPKRHLHAGCHKNVIAAAASEPEANERGSSLISRRLHYRGLQDTFSY